MRHVFVQNAGSVTDGTEADPSAVAAGEIAIFNARTGEALDLTPATGDAALPDEFFIVQGHADQPIMTGLLRRDNVKAIVKSAYVAPVKEVKTVTVPIGPTGGATFILKIIDNTPGVEPLPRYTTDIVVGSGEAAADIAGRFRTALTDQMVLVDGPFTISGATTDIIITADEGTTFEIALDGGMEEGTIADTTAFDLGRNTGEMLREMQEDNVGVMTGRYYRENGLLGSLEAVEITADAAASYLVYTILHENQYDKSINKSFANTEIILALDADVVGTFDTIFTDFL